MAVQSWTPQNHLCVEATLVLDATLTPKRASSAIARYSRVAATALSLHHGKRGNPSHLGEREDLMKCTGLLWVAVAAVIIVIGGCSNTEGTKTPESEPPAERGAAVGTGGAGANLKSDGEFVHDVASKNMAEIELSRMALDKSASPEVKAFAQMMIHDHGAAEDKLKSVVSGLAIDWPAQLDDKHRETADDLANNRVPISIATM